MKRKLFHQYILDDGILGLLPEFKKKKYHNAIFTDIHPYNKQKFNLINHEIPENILRENVQTIDNDRLSNILDTIPIDISVDTTNSDEEDSNEILEKDCDGPCTEEESQASTEQDSEEDDDEEDDDEDDESTELDSEEDDDEEDDDEDDESTELDSDEDDDEEDDDESTELDSDEDDDDESTEIDSDTTSSANLEIMDLSRLSDTSHTYNTSDTSDTYNEYDISYEYPETVLAYGTSIIKKDGDIMSESEYLIDVNGNNADIKIDVNGKPRFYANFKVNELLENIKSNNYNDFLNEINNVKRYDNSDASTSNEDLSEGLSETASTSNEDLSEGLSETASTSNEDLSEGLSESLSETASASTDDVNHDLSVIQSDTVNSVKETESQVNKSLNEFITIEKAEPEPGDKHSSEIIIHINHDKKNKL
jgi:hypothetical protein